MPSNINKDSILETYGKPRSTQELYTNLQTINTKGLAAYSNGEQQIGAAYEAAANQLRSQYVEKINAFESVVSRSPDAMQQFGSYIVHGQPNALKRMYQQGVADGSITPVEARPITGLINAAPQQIEETLGSMTTAQQDLIYARALQFDETRRNRGASKYGKTDLGSLNFDIEDYEASSDDPASNVIFQSISGDIKGLNSVRKFMLLNNFKDGTDVSIKPTIFTRTDPKTGKQSTLTIQDFVTDLADGNVSPELASQISAKYADMSPVEQDKFDKSPLGVKLRAVAPSILSRETYRPYSMKDGKVVQNLEDVQAMGGADVFERMLSDSEARALVDYVVAGDVDKRVLGDKGLQAIPGRSSKDMFARATPVIDELVAKGDIRSLRTILDKTVYYVREDAGPLVLMSLKKLAEKAPVASKWTPEKQKQVRAIVDEYLYNVRSRNRWYTGGDSARAEESARVELRESLDPSLWNILGIGDTSNSESSTKSTTKESTSKLTAEEQAKFDEYKKKLGQ